MRSEDHIAVRWQDLNACLGSCGRLTRKGHSIALGRLLRLIRIQQQPSHQNSRRLLALPFLVVCVGDVILVLRRQTNIVDAADASVRP
jgi:hypothetical protein